MGASLGMLDVGTLELLAEVSIALAGFSGVVLILGRRSSGHLPGLDQRRLHFLLETTLGAFFLSVIPLVANAGAMPYRMNLRFCSTAMLAFLLALAAMFILRGARLSQPERARLVRPLEIILGALLVPLSVGLLFVVFGAWGQLAMSIYLAGLTVLLLAASFQFYLLLSDPG